MPAMTTPDESAATKDNAAAEAPTEAPTEAPAESAPSNSPTKKKRSAEIQLNKDEHPEGEDCDEDEDKTAPFARASDEELKKRRIVKAKSSWMAASAVKKVEAGGENGASKANPFSSVSLSPGGSSGSSAGSSAVFGSAAKGATFGSGSFGSGFSGVGFGSVANAGDKAASSGFGSSAASSFGSSFGAAASNGFGAASSGLGSKFVPSTPSAAAAPTPLAAAGASVANGEEGEECLYQVRAKLFRSCPDDEAADQNKKGAPLGGDVHSVPSTKGRMELKKGDDNGKPAAPEGTAAAASQQTTSRQEPPKMTWKEAGIGPVRILRRKPNDAATKDPSDAPGADGNAKSTNQTKETKSSTAGVRVVQRRETAPGSQGTKLILNVPLLSGGVCRVYRQADKFVGLNVPLLGDELDGNKGDAGDSTKDANKSEEKSKEATEAEKKEVKVGNYLFKVKTTAEADSLQEKLEEMIQ